MYVILPFFLHKMLASHRQPTFRDSRWTNYSNPGQLYPPRPPNFKVVFFFQGLRRVDKTNQTPQHDTSRTHSLTLTFGEGGVVQSFPRGLNILSIYGMSMLSLDIVIPYPKSCVIPCPQSWSRVYFNIFSMSLLFPFNYDSNPH